MEVALIRSSEQEEAEDVFFGQAVINWARWFVIAAAMVLVLWTANDVDKLVFAIVPVVALVGMNFYLHGRHLAERPANRGLITVSSLIDLSVITGVILLWTQQTGILSPFYVMYYPVVLAFAFVMPPRISVTYTAAVLAAYAGTCILAEIAAGTDSYILLNANADISVPAIKALVIRLITLGAMGALGTYYWRVQRDRRRQAAGVTPGPRREQATA